MSEVTPEISAKGPFDAIDAITRFVVELALYQPTILPLKIGGETSAVNTGCSFKPLKMTIAL